MSCIVYSLRRSPQIILSCLLLGGISLPLTVSAQDTDSAGDLESVIETADSQPADAEIGDRLSSIYTQIEALDGVEVTVREGVVILSGSTANDAQAQRALDLAMRLQGVVTVDDQIERTLDIEGNVRPLVDQFESDVRGWFQALPLLGLSLLTFLLIAWAGSLLARWSALWNRIAPNPFLAELIAQAVRVIALIFALVVSLSLMGATALMGTILGGAGVLGLAVGFAVRDTMENYISSIMLSLRQPFRANDHVVIGEHEGKVSRLTSRATILVTLDGNHLRIPNSTVFKAVILNYTRNPERRFDFLLGVDANDDPLTATSDGIEALKSLEFVLDKPAPSALIQQVGDSSIGICFKAWVNQNDSDFGKARSVAISAVKDVLEDNGFTLPEPIYRLRFDQPLASGAAQVVQTDDKGEGAGETVAARRGDEGAGAGRGTRSDEGRKPAAAALDVSPDADIERMVDDERAVADEKDLLDDSQPVE